MGLPGTWHEWLFESFVYQNGGRLAIPGNTRTSFDSPAVVEALTFWQKLMQHNLMERGRNWRGTMNNFVKLQKYPVIYYSSAGMRTVEQQATFTWTTTIMPKQKQYSAGVGASNLFLSSHLSSAQQAAGWRLITFLTRQDTQAKIAYHTGYFPVVQQAFSSSLLRKRYNSDPAFINSRKQLDFAKAKIMTRHYKDIRKILQHAIDRSLNQGIPPLQSLSEAQIQANRLLTASDTGREKE